MAAHVDTGQWIVLDDAQCHAIVAHRVRKSKEQNSGWVPTHRGWATPEVEAHLVRLYMKRQVFCNIQQQMNTKFPSLNKSERSYNEAMKQLGFPCIDPARLDYILEAMQWLKNVEQPFHLAYQAQPQIPQALLYPASDISGHAIMTQPPLPQEVQPSLSPDVPCVTPLPGNRWLSSDTQIRTEASVLPDFPLPPTFEVFERGSYGPRQPNRDYETAQLGSPQRLEGPGNNHQCGEQMSAPLHSKVVGRPQQFPVGLADSTNRFSMVSSISSMNNSIFSDNTGSSGNRTSSYSMSSAGSIPSQPIVQLSNVHDNARGLWNDRLRVVPCALNHTAGSYDHLPLAAACTGCGFSEWHALCIFAENYPAPMFEANLRQMRDRDMKLEPDQGFQYLDFAGNTPLMYLAAAGVGERYLGIYEQLFQYEQDYFVQNSFGQNPLHIINPTILGEALITILKSVKRCSYSFLIQRDEDGRTPLQALLQYPLSRLLYAELLSVWDSPDEQLSMTDRHGNDSAMLMAKAARKMRKKGLEQHTMMAAGRDIIIKCLNAKLRTRVPNGFHLIARGDLPERNSDYGYFIKCYICNGQTHGRSMMEMASCARLCGHDLHAYERGATAAHVAAKFRWSVQDFMTMAQDADLRLRTLLSPESENPRQVLRALDGDGRSLVFNLATKGFHDALSYVLAFEPDARRQTALVNTCEKEGSDDSRGKSVVAANRMETDMELNRLTTISSQGKSPDCSKLNGLINCMDLLLQAGGVDLPSPKKQWQTVGPYEERFESNFYLHRNI